MEKKDIERMNSSTLAYLGDAVFEVIVREKIVLEKPGDVGRAHHTAVRYVSAAGQALAAKAMIAEGFLTEEEEKIYKKARNHRSMSRPQNADPREYKIATGFEALLGFLFLSDDRQRLREIAAEAVRIVDSSK
ncbi:MAG: ribonuclease III [Clostridiales bacterium]|nr:ribonuclease III [Clostridiales bacterium]MBR0468994.1 Mini-ribonuclease 3 [Mogibacterium sp.]